MAFQVIFWRWVIQLIIYIFYLRVYNLTLKSWPRSLVNFELFWNRLESRLNFVIICFQFLFLINYFKFWTCSRVVKIRQILLQLEYFLWAYTPSMRNKCIGINTLRAHTIMTINWHIVDLNNFGVSFGNTYETLIEISIKWFYVHYFCCWAWRLFRATHFFIFLLLQL